MVLLTFFKIKISICKDNCIKKSRDNLNISITNVNKDRKVDNSSTSIVNIDKIENISTNIIDGDKNKRTKT